MKIFVTGGSGNIGSALIPQLVAAGHQVSSLARSDASASKVSALGATPVKGTHTDVDVLEKAASEADAAIHLAFNHDIAFTGGMDKACEEDRAALTALGNGLVKSSGSNKVLINTSGLLGFPPGTDENTPMPGHSPRAASETLTHSYGDKGIKTLNIRLAPICSGDGIEHPFFSAQIRAAKANGFAAIVAEGKALWSGTHSDDVASLYALALEKAPSGVALHAIGQGNIPTKSMAELISSKLNIPTKELTAEEAMQANLGAIGLFLSFPASPSFEQTKKWTGWEPVKSDLLAQLATYEF